MLSACFMIRGIIAISSKDLFTHAESITQPINQITSTDQTPSVCWELFQVLGISGKNTRWRQVWDIEERNEPHRMRDKKDEARSFHCERPLTERGGTPAITREHRPQGRSCTLCRALTPVAGLTRTRVWWEKRKCREKQAPGLTKWPCRQLQGC